MSLPHVRTYFPKSAFLITRAEAGHAFPVKISDADLAMCYSTKIFWWKQEMENVVKGIKWLQRGETHLQAKLDEHDA